MDHGTVGRAEAPRLDGGVGTDVSEAVLLQHEVRWSFVENLLRAIVERFPPHDLALRVDEPDVLGIGPLDGAAALLGVPLGKDLVQVHAEQLGGVWHFDGPFVGVPLQERGYAADRPRGLRPGVG